MPEEEFKAGNLNNPDKKSEPESQIDNFPKITKVLEKQLKDKKDTIQNVLMDEELKKLFEKLLSSDTDNRIKCIEELMQCPSNETEIKKIILANLPEGYAYNVSTNEVVKTEIKKTEYYSGAMVTDRDTEQAKTDTEQAKTDTEQAKMSAELATESKESLLAMSKAIEERTKLTTKYTNLDSVTNENSDNYQTVKAQLENNGILNQLRKSNHDEQFINNYILVQTTLQELKSNPTNYEQDDISTFDKIVKSLDNACKIADTNLNSFSSENVTQTRHELFNSDIGNEDLIEAKQSNLKSRDYKEMFPDKTEEEMVQIYGKFLAKGAQPYLKEYNEHMNGSQTEKEEYMKTKNYKAFIDTIKNIKTVIDNKTKDLMEELCIISQIKGMYMCMGEGDNFDLNKAKEIKSKNGVLTLNGHIDGVNFAIRQDTNNPDAKLQTYKKIVKKDGDTFNVGGENNFVDSNFILPTQSDIFKLAVESVNSDGALNDAESPKDYVKKVQERFMLRVDNMYLDTKYVHHYMKEQVKGEKIVDNSLKLIKQVKPSIENVFSNVNQTTNNDLYNFVRILNFNIENSTDYEKDKLNFCIDKIREVINNYRTEEKSSGLYSHDISNYLENDTWIDGKGNENKRLGLISGLFTHFNENPIDKSRVGYEGGGGLQTNMIINDLYIQLHDKPKEKEKQQNRDLVAEKERTDAEHELNSVLGNMA